MTLAGNLIVVFVGWLILTLVLAFAVGSIPLFAPFVPAYKSWLQSVTLYDAGTSLAGIAYALVMSVSAIAIGLGGDDIKRINTFEKLMLVAGTLTTICLTVGTLSR